MFRIDSSGNLNGMFTQGNPQVNPPVPPTVISDTWLNAVQEEIAHFIEASGGTLNKADSGQLWESFVNYISPESVLHYPVSCVQGDLLYVTAPNVLSRLPLSNAGLAFLSNQGAGNNPAWFTEFTGSGAVVLASGPTINNPTFTGQISGITPSDIPVLNQNTTGQAGSVSSLSGHNISELINNAGYITSSASITGSSASCTGNAASATVAYGLSQQNDAGLSTGWNRASGSGETDFYNYSQGAGTGLGGFNFYNCNTSNNYSPVLIASISGSGMLTMENGASFGGQVNIQYNSSSAAALIVNNPYVSGLSCSLGIFISVNSANMGVGGYFNGGNNGNGGGCGVYATGYNIGGYFSAVSGNAVYAAGNVVVTGNITAANLPQRVMSTPNQRYSGYAYTCAGHAGRILVSWVWEGGPNAAAAYGTMEIIYNTDSGEALVTNTTMSSDAVPTISGSVLTFGTAYQSAFINFIYEEYLY